MKQKEQSRNFKKYGRMAAAAIFWLVVWQLVSMRIETKILFASPVSVFLKLGELIQTAVFWHSAAFSFLRIAAGFILALAAGSLLAVISAACTFLRELISPLMKLIKAVPVASFVILALLWVSSRNLSVLISFLMVLPVIYSNILQGILETDHRLLEMAKVFRVSLVRRVRYIYLPSVLPYLVSACSVGLGFCWKSGVAAEVIGIPNGSIGRQLYEAKLYLMTEDLFAWTFVIVAISVLFEKLIMAGIRCAVRKISQAGMRGSMARNPEQSDGKKCGENERAVKVQASPAPQIRVQNLSKSFSNQSVIDNLTLTFQAGRITCVMGQSGIGKTTLINLLMGLIKPDSGRIEGLENAGIAAVFQEDRLCEGLDALGNVALTAAPGVTAEQILEALTEVGITEGTGKPVSEFSGGMKRRTAIVRAAYAQSRVVFLDEPFKGLDEERKEAVMDWLARHVAGKTVVLITHEESEVRKLNAVRVNMK